MEVSKLQEIKVEKGPPNLDRDECGDTPVVWSLDGVNWEIFKMALFRSIREESWVKEIKYHAVICISKPYC
jgi:hypothetical protein